MLSLAMTEKAPSKRQFLLHMLTGSPGDCMEAAKKMIGGQIPTDHRTLAKIGRDKSLEVWPRIAAIYALGLLGERKFADALGNIVADRTDDLAVRSHAAEALGNLGNKDITGVLRDVLRGKPPKELREACTYALGELRA